MNKSKQNGFTLVELMLVITVVAILAVFAVPAFTGFIERRAVNSATAELSSSISLARSEAIAKGRIALVCPSQDGDACGSAWNDGWIVYMEGKGDRQVLQVFRPGKVTIQGPDEFSVLPSGMLKDATGDLEFTILPRSGNTTNGKLITFSEGPLIPKIDDIP